MSNVINAGVADGVHPTSQGYALIAAVIYQAIRDYRLPAERIVCLGDSITFGAHMPGAGTATGLTYPARLVALLDEAGICK